MNTELTLNEFEATSHETWKIAAEEALKGAPFEKVLCKKMPEGVLLQPIYDAENSLPVSEAWPGMAPFVRGNFPGSGDCRVLREIVASTPNGFREIADAECAGGDAMIVRLAPSFADGLSVGTVGEMQSAFAGVVTAERPVFVETGASAVKFTELIDAAGIQWHGAVLADPLSRYAAQGELPGSVEDLFDELAALARWNLLGARGLKTVGLDVSEYAEAGCHAVEEIAFLAATLAETIRELAKRNVSLQEAAPQILATISLGAKIFPQIAKIRAARWVASRIFHAFGVADVALAIHGRTPRINKSVLDPHTNILRATAEAFAGIVAGLESIEVAPYDAPTGTSTAFSRRIAHNVPVILLEEAGFGRVADAAGGSWYVETLTRGFAEKAWSLFQEIEAGGGMAAAIREGRPQTMARHSGAALRTAVASRREAVIGVNLYPNPAETFVPAKTSVPQNESALQAIRLAADYESLRDVAARFREAHGSLPVLWLANFGPPKQCKARADFSSGFFAAGGFDVRQGPGAKSVEEALSCATASEAAVVVICSTDETYPEIIPAFVPSLKTALLGVRVILAGHPGENEAAYRGAGVDEFIHIKVNCLEFLQRLHLELGLDEA